MHKKLKLLYLFYRNIICYNKLSCLCNLFWNKRGDFLIKNNLEIDVKSKCVEEGITQAQLAGKVGTTDPYVNRIIKKPEGVVNKTFISMMEQLGYDIEMVYVKKKKYE